MKSINKLFNLALGVLLGFGAVSCTDSAEYTSAEAVSGAQVFFAPASTGVSNYDLAGEEGTIEVQLQRVVTKGDLNVSIELTQEGDLKPLIAPATASFKDGEEMATVVLNYKTDGMEYDEAVKAALTITDEANLTPYASSTYEFSVVVPAPWTPWISTKADWVKAGYDPEAWPLHETMSTCTYTYVNYWGGDDPGLPIAYRQYLLDPTVAQFKVGNWGAGSDLIIEYNTATHNCQVLPQYVTDNATYGAVTVADVAHWQGNDAYYDSYPCFYNPETGQFVLTCAYYVSAGSYGYDPEYIQVDGFYVADYSVSAEFDGVLTDKNQNVFAQILVDYGVDAESVKAYVAQKSDDAAAVADALASGDVEGFDVVKGLNKIPLGELTGELKVVIATIAEGEAKAVTSVSFEYYGGGASSPWQSLGMGLYTDGIIPSLFGVEPVTYPVEIMESTATPGLYRVMNPYSNSVYPYAEDDCAEEGLFLEVHAEDPEAVYIEQQSLGVDWGYGEMSFVTEGARLMAQYDLETLKGAGYLGTLKEGVITFPVFEYGNGNAYQGILFMGDKGYYAGGDNVRIVLPEAVPAEVKAKKVAKKHSSRKFQGVKYQMNKVVNKQLVRAAKPAPFKK